MIKYSSLFLVACALAFLGCSDDEDSGKVCTADEETACTTAYTTCSSEAAANADMQACNQCIEDYCKCYSNCGNTCDKSKLTPCE
ncbi:MAG TPA: hypothetical protein PKL73_23705 [Polyangiaceae bacterium]|jgi:hypothetical protein|nr:hypothetical protein [Polyangiaceae bacterium]HPB96772.1 hypothetical protein [Polyangiaceae bacterium]